jgi:hypothetical protein
MVSDRHGGYHTTQFQNPDSRQCNSHVCIVSVIAMIYIVIHCVWRNSRRRSGVIGIAFGVEIRKLRFGGVTTAFGTYALGKGHMAV